MNGEHEGYAKETYVIGGAGRWWVGRCYGCDYRSGKCAHPGQAQSRAREHATAKNAEATS